MPTSDSPYECAVCGKVGIPPADCEQCEGRAKVQPRSYTVTELSTMDPEKREKILHGDRPSGAAPKVVKLPGSA